MSVKRKSEMSDFPIACVKQELSNHEASLPTRVSPLRTISRWLWFPASLDLHIKQAYLSRARSFITLRKNKRPKEGKGEKIQKLDPNLYFPAKRYRIEFVNSVGKAEVVF